MNRVSLKLLMVACLAVSPCLMSGVGITASRLAAQETKPAEEAPKENARKPPRGRVPNGFGKIGISEQQKEEIYEIQARYRDQVDALLVQLEELKSQEAEEIVNILTDDQKEALKKYRAGAAAKRKTSATATE